MLDVLGTCRAAVAVSKNTPPCASVENPGLQKPGVFLLVLGISFSHCCSSLAGGISVLGAGVSLDVIPCPSQAGESQGAWPEGDRL